MPTKKTGTTKTSTKTKTRTNSKPNNTVVSTVLEEVVDTTNSQRIQIATEPIPIKKQFDNNDMVAVTNNTRGTLIYVSKRMQGYEVIWRRFGDTEYMEYGELLSMRNSALSFFTNNWVTIADREVLKALGVEKYYSAVPEVEKFDSLFYLSPQEIQNRIAGMTTGMKETVALRALELIENGDIDSRKTIKALECALNKKLLEDF